MMKILVSLLMCLPIFAWASSDPSPEQLNSKLCVPMPASGGYGPTSVTVKRFLTLFKEMDKFSWDHPHDNEWVYKAEKKDHASGQTDKVNFTLLKTEKGLAVTQISSGKDRLTDANAVHTMVMNMVAQLMMTADTDTPKKSKGPTDKLKKYVGKYGSSGSVSKGSAPDTVKISFSANCMKDKVNMSTITFKDQEVKLSYSNSDMGYVGTLKDQDCQVRVLLTDMNDSVTMDVKETNNCCNGMLEAQISKNK